jgi:hypothetical protein
MYRIPSSSFSISLIHSFIYKSNHQIPSQSEHQLFSFALIFRPFIFDSRRWLWLKRIFKRGSISSAILGDGYWDLESRRGYRLTTFFLLIISFHFHSHHFVICHPQFCLFNSSGAGSDLPNFGSSSGLRPVSQLRLRLQAHSILAPSSGSAPEPEPGARATLLMGLWKNGGRDHICFF